MTSAQILQAIAQHHIAVIPSRGEWIAGIGKDKEEGVWCWIDDGATAGPVDDYLDKAVKRPTLSGAVEALLDLINAPTV